RDWRALRATVRGEHGAIELWNVHLAAHRLLADPVSQASAVARRLGQVTAEQQLQVRSLLDLTRGRAGALIAGDFNATRDLPVHAWLREELQDTWEVGARGLGSTVDVLG